MKNSWFIKFLVYSVVGYMSQFSLNAQTMYYYPFESGDTYTNSQCFSNWSSAGSSAYKNTHYPYRVIDAVKDLNLKTDGSDNTYALRESIKNIKIDHANDLIVILFPAGTYVFNSVIDFSSITDVILKGENKYPGSSLKFNHSTNGISINGCQRIGIEDITLRRITTATSGSNIHFENSSDCWVSGISSYEAYKFHIELQGIGSTSTSGVHNITITGSLFYDALAHGDNGEGYGVQFDGGYNCLVDNCIFRKLRHSISFQQDPSFNVVAYNASYEPQWTTKFGEDPVGYEPPDLNFHGRFYTDPGPHHNLADGNRVEQVKFDYEHGSNGPHNTFFRDYLNDAFDITTTNKSSHNGYPYNGYNQKHQNVIGVWGVTSQDKVVIQGTIDWCDDTFIIDDEPTDMDSKVTSYYTWDQKPDYLPSDAWPYDPQHSVNAAERRSNTPLSESWSKYYCEPFMAKALYLVNNQNETTGTYKALSSIVSGPATVKSGSNVVFKAPDGITLTPGFDLELGATLTASSDVISCPNGIVKVIKSLFNFISL